MMEVQFVGSSPNCGTKECLLFHQNVAELAKSFILMSRQVEASNYSRLHLEQKNSQSNDKDKLVTVLIEEKKILENKLNSMEIEKQTLKTKLAEIKRTTDSLKERVDKNAVLQSENDQYRCKFDEATNYAKSLEVRCTELARKYKDATDLVGEYVVKASIAEKARKTMEKTQDQRILSGKKENMLVKLATDLGQKLMSKGLLTGSLSTRLSQLAKTSECIDDEIVEKPEQIIADLSEKQEPKRKEQSRMKKTKRVLNSSNHSAALVEQAHVTRKKPRFEMTIPSIPHQDPDIHSKCDIDSRPIQRSFSAELFLELGSLLSPVRKLPPIPSSKRSLALSSKIGNLDDQPSMRKSQRPNRLGVSKASRDLADIRICMGQMLSYVETSLNNEDNTNRVTFSTTTTKKTVHSESHLKKSKEMEQKLSLLEEIVITHTAPNLKSVQDLEMPQMDPKLVSAHDVEMINIEPLLEHVSSPQMSKLRSTPPLQKSSMESKIRSSVPWRELTHLEPKLSPVKKICSSKANGVGSKHVDCSDDQRNSPPPLIIDHQDEQEFIIGDKCVVDDEIASTSRDVRLDDQKSAIQLEKMVQSPKTSKAKSNPRRKFSVPADTMTLSARTEVGVAARSKEFSVKKTTCSAVDMIVLALLDRTIAGQSMAQVVHELVDLSDRLPLPTLVDAISHFVGRLDSGDLWPSLSTGRLHSSGLALVEQRLFILIDQLTVESRWMSLMADLAARLSKDVLCRRSSTIAQFGRDVRCAVLSVRLSSSEHLFDLLLEHAFDRPPDWAIPAILYLAIGWTDRFISLFLDPESNHFRRMFVALVANRGRFEPPTFALFDKLAGQRLTNVIAARPDKVEFIDWIREDMQRLRMIQGGLVVSVDGEGLLKVSKSSQFQQLERELLSIWSSSAKRSLSIPVKTQFLDELKLEVATWCDQLLDRSIDQSLHLVTEKCLITIISAKMAAKMPFDDRLPMVQLGELVEKVEKVAQHLQGRQAGKPEIMAIFALNEFLKLTAALTTI